MPKLSGDQVAKEMRRIEPSLATVLITGWERQENDSRMSAFDFQMQKPMDNLDHVLNTVAQAIELHDARVKKRK
jgi:FixJ family two-component response regulator